MWQLSLFFLCGNSVCSVGKILCSSGALFHSFLLNNALHCFVLLYGVDSDSTELRKEEIRMVIQS